ncbi:MAG: ferredoxin [Myxococcales bacterium]|nr:ferredoxin [Myxococcales bacterium]
MKPHSLRVFADRRLCFGAGACAVAAPATFSLDGDNRVVVGDVGASDAESLVFAAAGCPARALGVQAADGAWHVEAQRSSPP